MRPYIDISNSENKEPEFSIHGLTREQTEMILKGFNMGILFFNALDRKTSAQSMHDFLYQQYTSFNK